MTTKPQGLDHSGAHGAEPTGSVVIFTDITEEALEPLAAAAKTQVMTEAMGALVVFDGIYATMITAARCAGCPIVRIRRRKNILRVLCSL